ncbi:formylglycine-generating enzyme family protein [Maribacter halichondriae]|uniref:formylglycine-generating enzyme family protein n=1 Tax=Maribacter halichondriae TaxID=2980554 RepID=UPI00235A21B6|nr:SUMF1/EgtB/PvdO family nonheme iron enzyme [Maribacter sp. Hal144]
MKKSIYPLKGTYTILKCIALGVFFLGTACKSTQVVAEESPVESTEKEVEVYTEKIPETDISMDLVKIPAGSFSMGSPDSEANRKPDEGPQRTVELDAFWMGKYEVTWDVFELFFKQNKVLFESLEAEKLEAIDAITRPSPPYEDPSYGMGKDNYPAVSMSTYSALLFCKWLSNLTGRFYRLPTEAEWEYAARAGTKTAYSFGDNLNEVDKYAVYYKNAGNKYAQVGTKIPNKWGLYDMHGNVAEWTLDEYKEDAYATLEAKNPWAMPTVIHPRVYRGGSWDDDADKMRSAARTASSLKQQKKRPPDS